MKLNEKEETTMQERNTEKRTVPITNGFMDKNVNDKLYAYLQTKSYIDSDTVRFCYASTLNYTDLEKIFKGEFSRSKLHRDVKRFIDKGFIMEGTVVDLYGNDVEAYLLPFNTNDNIYKFIPLDTMAYMVEHLSLHSIKIYAYLMNRYHGFSSRYTFTKKELINVLGVSNPKKNDYKIVNEILSGLQECGLVRLAEFYDKRNNILSPKIRLVEVYEQVREENIKVNDSGNKEIDIQDTTIGITNQSDSVEIQDSNGSEIATGSSLIEIEALLEEVSEEVLKIDANNPVVSKTIHEIEEQRFESVDNVEKDYWNKMSKEFPDDSIVYEVCHSLI